MIACVIGGVYAVSRSGLLVHNAEEAEETVEPLFGHREISSGKWNEKPEVDMTEFPFYDAPDTATIICCHIMENEAPILHVSHDEDDGMWQFLCGETHELDEAKLVSLKWVFDYDNSIGDLKDMPCGYYADRKTQNDDWVIRKR